MTIFLVIFLTAALFPFSLGMLTLFHFSLPKWVQDNGGWTNEETIEDFVNFSKVVFNNLYL